MKYERLRAIAEIGSHESEESEEHVGYMCDYLSHVYRLNEAGVDWYMNLQTACNEVNVMYNKNLIPTKGKAYFKYLPEVNCCELLLLLEHRFYLDENERYAYLFKKYLFFFGHAVELSGEVHPVFFIDDALFACLTSLSTYLFSRASVLELEYELWMMALVHLRIYTSSKPRGPTVRTVDQQNLRRVANYVARKLSVDSRLFYETSLLYPIRHRNFYLREDIVYRLMYVDVQQLELRHFYELILKAALLERKVRRLVIYNAYTGEEMIIVMPRCVLDIRRLIVVMHMKIIQILRRGRHPLRLRNAVRMYKLFKFEVPDPPIPETFLIQGKEKCISIPSAVFEEVEFEPFSFDSFLVTLRAAEPFTTCM